MSQDTTSSVPEVRSVKDQGGCVNIALTVCTCNRPKGLARVIESLAQLRVPDNCSVQLVVVDNSPDGNADQTVEKLKQVFPWELSYIHETRSGISFARNASLDYVVPKQIDYMASVDDDMHVHPDWLFELFLVATNSGAAAVMGYLQFDYPGDRDWWVDEAYRLDKHAPADGALLDQGSTCGCLIKLDCVRSLNLRFDEDLNKSGGEDTLFFAQIKVHGNDIRYAAKALSFEVLGPERMRIRWWLKRWYRTGITTAVVSIATNEKNRAGVLYDGFVRIVLGVAGTVVCLPWLLSRRTKGMRAVRMIFRGSGYVAAAIGIRYDEYAGGGRGE